MSSSNSTCPGAMCPPPGQTADLNAPPPSVRKAWIAALVVELVVPTLLMPARIYARGWVIRVWTWADSVFVLAFALFIAEIGIGFSLLDYGVGQYAWNLPAATYSKFSEILNIQQVIYQPAIGFTKCSILLQLIEIFVPTRAGPRHWILIGFICFNTVYFTIMFFLELFECSPRDKIWKSDVPGKCIDIETTFIVTSVINVIEDFSILALPIFWTWKLHASTKRKLKIAAIFTAGLFACICSIMRLVETVKNVTNPDITVALVPVSLWCTAEISAGLLVACMPYIPKLIEHPPLLKGTRLWELTGMTLLRSFTSSKGSSQSLRTEKLGITRLDSEAVSRQNSTLNPVPYDRTGDTASSITQVSSSQQHATEAHAAA